MNLQDHYDQNRFALNLRFAAGHYAQLMQNRMLVLNFAIAEPIAVRLPSVPERTEPVILDGGVYRKRVDPVAFRI